MHAPTKYLPVECIFCEEVFRIPQNSAADSVIACPLCHQKFKAKLALAGDAPIAQPITEIPVDLPHTQVAEDAGPAKHRVAPSGRLTPRYNTKSKHAEANQSFKQLKPKSRRSSSRSGSDSSESSRENSLDTHAAESKQIGSSTSSDNDSTFSSHRDNSTAERGISDRGSSDRSSSRSRRSESSGRSRSDSYRSSGESRRSRRRSSSRLEKDKGWNNIGVDGLPIKRSRKKLAELQEHDGSEGTAREIVLICLGGLACLPVTQLCLWWFVNIDPLHLGPSISSVIPQVVPAEFHSKSASTDAEGTSVTTDAQDNSDGDNPDVGSNPATYENTVEEAVAEEPAAETPSS